MSRRPILPALLVLALSGLSGLAPASAQTPPAPPAAPGADAAPSFPIPKAGGGEAEQIEMIAGLCGVQMKAMSPLACRCLAERAMTDISAPQRDYLIATVVSPPVADRMLADRRVGQADQAAIFAFLNATSDSCASGTFRPQPGAAAPAAPAAPAPAAPAPAAN